MLLLGDRSEVTRNEVVPLTHVGPDLSKQQANPASDDPRISKNIGYAVREGLLDFGEGFCSADAGAASRDRC